MPFFSTTAMEVVVNFPVISSLVFPDWDAVVHDPRPFRLYCEASRDRFVHTVEQEQTNGSVCPILFNSRATLDNQLSGTPFKIEASSNGVGCRTCPRTSLLYPKFRIYALTKVLENVAKVADHNARL